MKIALSSCVALAALCASPVSAKPVAIIHAKAWTMTAADPVPDATILMDGGLIVSVISGGPVPDGVRTIDAQGRTVTPGLVNSATQIGLIEVSSAATTRDQISQADGLGAGFDVSLALNPNSTLIALARADGVTGALSYPQRSDRAPFAGQAVMLKLRTTGGVLDHRGAAVVAVIGGDKWPKEAGSRAAQWQLLRIAFEKVTDRRRASGKADAADRGQDDGASGSPPGGDDAVIRAAVEGRMPLAIFTNRESDIREAIRFARDFPVHLVIMGGGEAWRAADALAAANIPVVLSPQANMPASFDELGNRLDAAAILQKAGVMVAFGMAGGAIGESYNAGLDLRTGAGIAVANGMPYIEALKAITVNGHRLWGGGEGTLAAGQFADLVIWDGDPLEPLTNATTVVIDGEPVSTDNRQRALELRYLPLATSP